MWYVGLDVHLDSTVVSIRNRMGAVTKRLVVASNRTALKRALRDLRGKVRIVCESGPMASWVRDTFETRFREVVVCDRRRTRLTASGAKTDRIDADRLSDLSRRQQFHAVHVPRAEAALLRRLAIHYSRMKGERSRVIQRLRALYFECGIRVKTARATPERVPLGRLRAPGAKQVARSYLRQLETLTELTREARTALVSFAQRSSDFSLLQTIPYVGEIRASELLAIVETPHRFRSLRAFWAYGGLGVVQKISSEHRIENGRAIREDKARGIKLRVGQPILKRVLRDVALHASLGRGHFRAVFEAHVARGKTPAIARIALARKIAAIILAVWRSGAPYSETLATKSRDEHPG